jgi:hypothetical protein
MPLSTPQFPLYRLADQVSPLLAVLKNGVHAVKCALWETCRNLFVIDLFSTHAEI